MAASFAPTRTTATPSFVRSGVARSSVDRAGSRGSRLDRSGSRRSVSPATGWTVNDARRVQATRRMYLQRRLGVLLVTIVAVAVASLLLFGNGGVAATLDQNAPVQTYR
ncbi:MAG: hypothetical protein GX868_16515, partial [Actinobacteria bacterium]|nr:hypothetical protein [Actinomycetota bacterium]